MTKNVFWRRYCFNGKWDVVSLRDFMRNAADSIKIQVKEKKENQPIMSRENTSILQEMIRH